MARFTEVLNPAAADDKSYRPGGTSVIAAAPISLVWIVRRTLPVSEPINLTVAFGIAAPEASRIVIEKLPVDVWERAATARKKENAIAKQIGAPALFRPIEEKLMVQFSCVILSERALFGGE